MNVAFVVLKAVANIVLFLSLFQMVFESFLIFFVKRWFVVYFTTDSTDDLFYVGCLMLGAGCLAEARFYRLFSLR